jgi:hypothetical protein
MITYQFQNVPNGHLIYVSVFDKNLAVKLKDNFCFYDVKYQLVAPEALVCQIINIEAFSLSIGKVKREVIPLVDLEDGMVFELPTGNGLISLFCSTDQYVFTGRVCLLLGWPTRLTNFCGYDMPPNIEVQSIGPCWIGAVFNGA